MATEKSRKNGSLVWFRRDLRLEDHAALSAALLAGGPVWCAFVFDTAILDPLPSRVDRRVEFIHAALLEMDRDLRRAEPKSGLIVRYGAAREEIPRLAAELGVAQVYAGEDYEPRAIARDLAVAKALKAEGRDIVLLKDHVVLGPAEVLTGAGRGFSVFTPYKNAWMKRLTASDIAPRACRPHFGALGPLPASCSAGVPGIEKIGFETTNLKSLGIKTGASGATALLRDFAGRIGAYGEARDFPAVKGVSYLSVHLRFGTVSIRELVRTAKTVIDSEPANAKGAEKWLSELVWREFYVQVLGQWPHVVEHAFRPEFDRIEFAEGPEADRLFAAWCEGRTGFPLVDAAMRQINQTGYMHNRLRMVAASFLVKDLGIHWKRGEAYFADHLLDFDLSANNGGWQWAASSGCDAQPWFRIFNPVMQSEKFDAEGKFIRRYVPELAKLPPGAIHAPWTASPMELAGAGIDLGRDYPLPVVDHGVARQRTLERYSVVKNRAAPA